MKYKVFISSVQREFSTERRELCNYIRTDYLLARFFQPIIFEETPATEDSAQKVYLKEAGESDIYLGLFGNLYGYEDEEGISPTEREFDEATRNHRYRLIFIRTVTEEQRHLKQQKLIEKVERQIVRRTFVDIEDLFHCVYASLVRFLEEHEFIRVLPFDAAKDTGASMEELEDEKIREFIRVAIEHRKLALPSNISSADLLRHFDLMDEQGRVANAAILLFGKKPQKYFLPSEVKCVQFYGTVVEKPIPRYKYIKEMFLSLSSKLWHLS